MGLRGKGFGNPTDQGVSFVTVHASVNHDWTRLQEAESNTSEEETGMGSGGIRAEYSYSVEMSRLPNAGTPKSDKEEMS